MIFFFKHQNTNTKSSTPGNTCFSIEPTPATDPSSEPSFGRCRPTLIDRGPRLGSVWSHLAPKRSKSTHLWPHPGQLGRCYARAVSQRASHGPSRRRRSRHVLLRSSRQSSLAGEGRRHAPSPGRRGRSRSRSRGGRARFSAFSAHGRRVSPLMADPPSGYLSGLLFLVSLGFHLIDRSWSRSSLRPLSPMPDCRFALPGSNAHIISNSKGKEEAGRSLWAHIGRDRPDFARIRATLGQSRGPTL